jgi:hypothetical protein
MWPEARQRSLPLAGIDGVEFSWRASPDGTKAIPIAVPLIGAVMTGYGPLLRWLAPVRYATFRERDSTGCQMQKLPTVGKIHCVPLNHLVMKV